MSKQFRVLITDYAWPDLSLEQEALPQAELIVAAVDDAEMIRQAQGVDAILTCWRQLPHALLDAATDCRIVARYGVGLDNIPVDHASALGMLVTNVPDFCIDEVSDHALALLLACARNLAPFVQDTRAGRWNLRAGIPMRRLRGQTLGLVGYGNIAQQLAHKGRALGMEIIAYTPRLAPHALDPWGRVAGSLDELLAASDYVSLHVPLTAQTQGLIDARALAQMKPTAFLINTARGAIADESALLHALNQGTIAGAALDVLTQEPPPPDHPLLALPQVIVTPHAAFVSAQASVELIQKAAANVAHALQGERPPYLVNPQVLQQENCRLEKKTGS